MVRVEPHNPPERPKSTPPIINTGVSNKTKASERAPNPSPELKKSSSTSDRVTNPIAEETKEVDTSNSFADDVRDILNPLLYDRDMADLIKPLTDQPENLLNKNAADLSLSLNASIAEWKKESKVMFEQFKANVLDGAFKTEEKIDKLIELFSDVSLQHIDRMAAVSVAPIGICAKHQMIQKQLAYNIKPTRIKSNLLLKEMSNMNINKSNNNDSVDYHWWSPPESKRSRARFSSRAYRGRSTRSTWVSNPAYTSDSRLSTPASNLTPNYASFSRWNSANDYQANEPSNSNANEWNNQLIDNTRLVVAGMAEGGSGDVDAAGGDGQPAGVDRSSAADIGRINTFINKRSISHLRFIYLNCQNVLFKTDHFSGINLLFVVFRYFNL